MLLTKAELIDDAIRFTDGLAAADSDLDAMARRAMRRFKWHEIDNAIRWREAHALMASCSPVAADRALAAHEGYGTAPKAALSVCIGSGNEPILIFKDGSLLSEDNTPWSCYTDYFQRLIDYRALAQTFVEIVVHKANRAMVRHVRELLIDAGAAEVRIS